MAMPQDPGPTALIATPGNERAGHRRPFCLWFRLRLLRRRLRHSISYRLKTRRICVHWFFRNMHRQGAFAAKQLNQPQPHRRLLLLSLAPTARVIATFEHVELFEIVHDSSGTSAQ